MARFLVPTHLHDVHATAVAQVLRQRGHETVLWHGADFPTRQTASMRVSREHPLEWRVSGPALDLEDADFDVVWLRRRAPPVLPTDLHPGDRQVAQRDCVAFDRALWQAIAPDARWINPPEGRAKANDKPIQLREAVRAGLSVPPTLFSNDPGDIRGFLREHGEDTIFKPFTPAQWEREGGVAVLFTSRVTLDDLPEDDLLRLTPGIYQPRIAKDHELRVTYMGDYAVVGKLFSQEAQVSQLDWKRAFTDIRVAPGEIPPDVDRGCRELMKRLGIVFGCFDFIVTPEGGHVFVEVNESGQFLWIEELAPEIKMLEPFCRFLVEGWLPADWQVPVDAVSFHDRYAEALREQEADVGLHVEREYHHSVSDLEEDEERVEAE